MQPSVFRRAVLLLTFVGAASAARAQQLTQTPVQFPFTMQTAVTDCSTPSVLTLPDGTQITFKGGQFVHYMDANFDGTMYMVSSAAGCGTTGPDLYWWHNVPFTQATISFSQPVTNLSVNDYNILATATTWEGFGPGEAVGFWDASGYEWAGYGRGFSSHELNPYSFPYPPPEPAAYPPITLISFVTDSRVGPYIFYTPPTDWLWGITSLTMAQKPLAATGQILDGSAMETKTITSPDQPIYAQVPLGLELQLGIQKNGSYVKSKFTLGTANLTDVATPSLYPSNALLEYSRDLHEGQKTFRAVHLGTQPLTVTPDDTTLKPFKFTVGVFDPGNLGNTDVQYDPLIVTWGNRRGIPPHILKGLIKKETGGFDPDTYRYEPLNHDTGDLGVSVINNVLEDDPYEHYRLATAAGLSRGDLLIDLNSGSAYTTVDDISPRHVLVRSTGQNLTPLDVCPAQCVSVRELVLANDDVQNWTVYASFDINDPADLATIDFTAQTALAASFGLMQTMYVVAAELNWSTTDGRQNPSLLFDSPANENIGGGSLAVGTWEFYKRYRACRTGDWATDPDFSDSAAYESMIIDALNYYNHGSKPTNVTYGADAWALSLQYIPAHPLSRIFP